MASLSFGLGHIIFIRIVLEGCYAYGFIQGQARGYRRVTNLLPLPLVGHDFQGATVTTHWPADRQISNPRKPWARVPNERYGHCLSTDSFWFIVGQMVWSEHIVKVEYFLMVFGKSHIFTQRWKQIFKNFFFKMISFEDELMKMHDTNFKLKFISRKSSEKYLKCCSFRVICPYPPAFP